MALFGGKKEEVLPGLIGVDLGSGGIKVLELVPEHDRLRLSTYGYAEQKTPNGERTAPIEHAEKTAAVLKKILKEGGFRVNRAVAALPATNVFHAIITLPAPKDAKTDLKPLIESQARKLLPLPLEEMVLDSNVLDRHLLPKEGEEQKEDAESKYIRVLLTGAPKTIISAFVDLFKKVGLELVSLETEVFALTRALAYKEKTVVMIVDLGAERSSLSVVENGIPLLTRVIKSGGNVITQALAHSMGIGFAEAEAMKRDLAFAQNGALPPPLLEALKPLVHEVKYALQMYNEQPGASSAPVQKILVTGGSSRLPGLDAYFTEALNMTVYLGNPWSRVIAPENLKPILEEIGPRFSVAIGLAERLQEKG